MRPRALNLISMLFCLALQARVGAETHDVTVQNFSFEPNDLAIQAGDTVRWTNVSGTHDVKDDAGAWGRDSGSGWVFEWTFDDPGIVLYHCSVHSFAGRDINIFMNGRLTVTAPPDPAAIFGDGFE